MINGLKAMTAGRRRGRRGRQQWVRLIGTAHGDSMASLPAVQNAMNKEIA